MKVLLPWILFAASAAFNVFFVAGMFTPHRGRHGSPGPEDRTAFLARALELDGGQRDALLTLEKKADEDRARITSERDARFASLVEELAKDSPRPEIVREFTEAPNASARERHFVDYLTAVMKLLRPDQRGKAAESFKQWHAARGRRGAREHS